jgi:hypothetical protein
MNGICFAAISDKSRMTSTFEDPVYMCVCVSQIQLTWCEICQATTRGTTHLAVYAQCGRSFYGNLKAASVLSHRETGNCNKKQGWIISLQCNSINQLVTQELGWKLFDIETETETVVSDKLTSIGAANNGVVSKVSFKWRATRKNIHIPLYSSLQCLLFQVGRP